MAEKQWTVTELTRYLRQLLEMDYRLSRLSVEGEVSNFRVPASGHAYFTLKDSKTQLQCVMFGYARQGHAYEPQQGDRVVARGNIGLYEAGGQYQLYCSSIVPVGLGSLHEEFERLKAQLQAEGVFDEAHKLPLPNFPLKIGIVTSASAAALQDALNVLSRRNPLATVVLSPSVVQGQAAPPLLIRALERLIDERPDVILLMRGGGSLEDLWAFNDEALVRTIADITQLIPVISGVGHEIDFTLVDFAASIRAPTPSAAAELATPVSTDDLRLHLDAVELQMRRRISDRIEDLQLEVQSAQQRLRFASPERAIEAAVLRLERTSERLHQTMNRQLEKRRQRLQQVQTSLEAVNPQSVLARGFAIVYSSEGNVLRNAADIPPNTKLEIQLQDGRIKAIALPPDDTD